MSDASSAGIARRTPGCGKTCRKDVPRGKVLKYKLRAEHAGHYRDVEP